MWEHLEAGQHRASPHPTNPITPTTTPNESTGHPGPGAAWSFPRLGTVSGCRVKTSLDASVLLPGEERMRGVFAECQSLMSQGSPLTFTKT